MTRKKRGLSHHPLSLHPSSLASRPNAQIQVRTAAGTPGEPIQMGAAISRKAKVGEAAASCPTLRVS